MSLVPRTMVLGLWAGFLAWLWIANEISRYLGPRTYWVVPFGALVLGAAAVAHVIVLVGRRDGAGAKTSIGDTVGLVVLLIPLVAVIAIPEPSLGALAASRKSAGTGVGALGSFAPAPDPEGEVEFIDIHFASQSEDYAARAGIVEGTEVDLTGFVTHRDAGAATFRLTRFYVSCCAADAIPYSVAVRAPGDQPDNQWLNVSGALIRDGEGYVLDAARIEPIEEPENPYLY